MSNLIRWSPFGHVSPFPRRDFRHRAFAPPAWFGDFPASFHGRLPSYGFDINETDAAYVVSAAVPGLAPADIKVELEGRTLTISGEAKTEEESGDGYPRRSFGSLHRSLRLPEGVDADSITASCENGVLTVTIPKPEAARAKAIEVKAA